MSFGGLNLHKTDLKITLRKVSSTFFKDVVTLPAFDLPKADVTVKLTTDLDKQTFTLHHLGVQAPGVEITAKGGVILKDNLQDTPPPFSGQVSRQGTKACNPRASRR